MLQRNFYKSGLTALALTAALAYAPLGSAALVNGGFEADDASGGDVGGATGWTTFESVFTNSTLGPAFGPVSHDAGGTQSLKMFGPFTGTGAAAGAFQNLPATAGNIYELDAWVMNWIGDPFGNLGILQLNFLDGAGNAIAGSGAQVTVDPFGTADVDLSVIQDGAEISDWTGLSLSAVAPAGTAEVQAFLLHIQTGDPCCSGGSLFWDDVGISETVVPVPAAVWLFGSGLIGLIGIARRRKA
jgi:hypothetical protein